MKKILYTLLILSFFIVSCEKQVFEEIPTDKYAQTVVWRSLDLVDPFVNEVYNGVGNWVTDGLALSSMTDDTYAMFTWSGEKIVAGMTLSPSNSNALGVNYNKGGTYSPDRAYTITTGKWGYMFSKIRATNQFFTHIDEVTGDQAIKDRMKGEVHFLRAYFYAQLVNVYGTVPIITKEFGIDDNFSDITKSSYQQVTDFIVQECDLAISLLPNSFPSEPGRATKGAAMALKAEQLLYAASPLVNGGNYDAAKLQKAKTAHEAIIDLGIYSLYRPADYRNIFLDKANPEIIFAKYTSGDLMIDRENTMERDIAPSGTGGYTAYCPLQSLVDDFEVIDGNNTFIPATWDGITRTVTNNPKYSDNDPYLNRDPRFYATILSNGSKRGDEGLCC